MRVSKFFIWIFSVLCLYNTVFTYAPTNFYKPYDINFRMFEWENTRFKLGMNFEYGDTRSGKNGDEDKVGILRLYNDSESALTMLMGAKKGSEIYNLANNLIPAYSPATDDGIRGHIKFDGQYKDLDWTIWGKYKLPVETLPGNFDFYIYVPFRYMEIDDIKIYDQTKNVLSSDRDVKFYLTDNLKENVKRLGDLNLNSWKKFGISDIVFMLGWYKDYKQAKEHLKNVRISFKLGLSVPSGSVKDEDEAFSLPLGNDGGWGIPLTAGLDLDFVKKFRAGLEFEMICFFDKTKEMRLKTDVNQTDYLFLHKGVATRSYGFYWKFNLYVQAKHFLGGLSAMVAYQFLKHDNDTLTAQSNDFSYNIINSAESLEEWGTQNFIFQFNYDFFKSCKHSWFKPQLSIFAKLPVTGKRVMNAYTFGGQFGLNF
ncbi:hypothetical protein ACFLYH_00130 [Candidatus Dependentiae bacterium]